MNIELKQNFARIFRTLEGQGMKITKLAHTIGFTSTTQLYNTIEGKSLLSTKAVQRLIENYNVNPMYLFLGKGDMFLTEKSEIETLKMEIREKTQAFELAQKTIITQGIEISDFKKKIDNLIELSGAAREYYKSLIKETPISETNPKEDMYNIDNQ